ncbi:MAG: FAD binding domain-containing protein [Spirochaetes bacterium]|nr:FAD binding domain-containing protein [Spirochaetota bacterium]
MIVGNPVYVRAESLEEALAAWQRYPDARYLAGGTEIHTLARRSAAYRVGALIDLKRIASLAVVEADGGWLKLGATASLSVLADQADWPLLSAVLRGIADRTVRNRLSLGGNVAGQLPYREALLPLLVAGAELLSVLPSENGSGLRQRRRGLDDCFDKRLQLEAGELVCGFALPEEAVLPAAAAVQAAMRAAPGCKVGTGTDAEPGADTPVTSASGRWYTGRRTRTGPVDYPLISLCAQRQAGGCRLATSGLYPYPWHSAASDQAFSQAVEALASVAGASRGTGDLDVKPPARLHSLAEEVARTVAATMPPPRSDSRASGEYRQALLQQLLAEALEALS